MLLDMGGPDSPTLHANADGAARVRNALTERLHDWSSPGYVDEIADAVSDVVEHGRGTVRITAATFGRPDGSRRLGIQVTHTDTSQVRTTWELDQTPRPVEWGPDPAPRPQRATGVDGDDRRNPMWGQDGAAVNQEYQRSVSHVRGALDDHLSENFPWLTRDQIYDAKLITSELYTNAVTYSPDHRGDIDITSPAEDKVRVSVSNALSPGAARDMAPWVPDQQSVERQGGRGTQLAHELSAACGRDLRFGTDGSTATHYFELHRSDGADDGREDPVIDMSAFADDLAELGFDADSLAPGRGSADQISPPPAAGEIPPGGPAAGNR
ncbi:MAG: ATP-binding protein [Nocardia sp.]|nr:ATP-binding protein [Nocardia sp.]